MLKVYIYYLHKKTIIRNVTTKSQDYIKIELTDSVLKNRTNLRKKFMITCSLRIHAQSQKFKLANYSINKVDRMD